LLAHTTNRVGVPQKF